MDNLIDKTSFSGLIAVVGMGQAWNNTTLTAYITYYQERLLKRFLGEHLYNLLDENYDSEVTDDKWYKLVNGDTYTKNYNGTDYTIKYKGLKPILTYFIYNYFKNGISTQPTEGGEVVSNFENSSIAPIDRKAIEAFNIGIDYLGEVVNYGDVDFVEFGDFPFFTTNISTDVLKGNMFNYITFKNSEDSTTYPNWIFKGYNKINEFGI